MTDQNKPESDAKSGAKRFLWTIAIAFTAFGVLVLVTLGKDAFKEHLAADRIPACNSAEVRALLTDIVKNNSNAFQTKSFIDFTDIVERSHKPDVERVCAGDLLENTGKSHIGFRLTLSSVGDLIGQIVPDPGPSAPAVAAPALTPEVATAQVDTSAAPSVDGDEAPVRPAGQYQQVPPNAFTQFLARPFPDTVVAMFGPSDASLLRQSDTALRGSSEWRMANYDVSTSGDGKRLTSFRIDVIDGVEGETKSDQRVELPGFGSIVLGRTTLKALGKPNSMDEESHGAGAIYPATAIYLRQGYKLTVECFGFYDFDSNWTVFEFKTPEAVSKAWPQMSECLVVGVSVDLQ